MDAQPTQASLLQASHRNHYLFSDYYLDRRAPELAEWRNAEVRGALDALRARWQAVGPALANANESQTEEDWIRPVLHALGHRFTVQVNLQTPGGSKTPDYILCPDETLRQRVQGLAVPASEADLRGALAVADAKAWDRPLDRSLPQAGVKTLHENPALQIDTYIRHSGLRWGVLTNGRLWRLYHADTSKKLDVFYQVDLPALLEQGNAEAFNYFWLFFRRQAFEPGVAAPGAPAWLESVLAESEAYEQGVSEGLKGQVYDALRELAQGFLDFPANGLAPTEETLREIHDNSLIALYRLLFILYAEARELLPVASNGAYRDAYSLAALKRRVAADLDAGKPAVASMSGLWQQLSDLWGVIDAGDAGLGVPAYNGGLFDPAKHPFLARCRAGDLHLRRAIDLLARTVDPRTGRREFVDYRDLEIRHLGSIYEGLLEYQLCVAGEPLVVRREKGRELYAPANGAVPDIAPGQLYLVTDKGERKATGSYYTPDYIVQYIVEHAVGPVLDEIAAPHREDPEALARAVLGVNVLDPAMGSGHFLVAAADFIARFLVEHGAAGRGDRPVALTTASPADGEGDLAYWRRRVAQACIYGVDLNPLAVELAKLSLWLATVSHDRPLSFLDHHLRCGNSLIGARVADLPLQGAPTAADQRRARKAAQEDAAARASGQLSMLDDSAFAGAMRAASRFMDDIERLGSETLADVEESERIYRETVRGQTERARRLADLWTARHFGLAVPEGQWAALAAHVLHGGGISLPRWDALLADAARIAAERRFFHWELEFPEVFFDEHGRLREGGGFDAVVGNPPYGYVQDRDVQGILAAHDPSVAGSDWYLAFIRQGLSTLRLGGCLGYIAPTSLQTGVAYVDFRRYLLQSAQARIIINLPYDVFPAAYIDTSIYVLRLLQCYRRENRPLSFKVDAHQFGKRERAVDGLFSGLALTAIDSGAWQDDEQLRFVIAPGVAALRTKLAKVPTTTLGELVDSARGILAGGADLLPAPSDAESKPFFAGELYRYQLSQDSPRWVVYGENLREKPSSYRFFTGERILVRRLISRQFRLMAMLVAEEFVNQKDLYNLVPLAGCKYTQPYLLSLLNSRFLSYIYIAHSMVATRDDFPQATLADLRRLPIRHVFFTTPPDERARLAAEGRELYAAYCDTWDETPLLAWVDTMLAARDLTGLPDLSGLPPERSDAVHDLLAHLAEQMIELHKARQAEMKGFLDWLGREIGAPLDSLTGKSQVRNYLGDYQKGEQALPFDDLLGILRKNARKLKADPGERALQERLLKEYEGSLAKLTPIKARLEKTDALIDRVVYRLYGLTEEEMAVVEGRR